MNIDSNYLTRKTKLKTFIINNGSIGKGNYYTVFFILILTELTSRYHNERLRICMEQTSGVRIA